MSAVFARSLDAANARTNTRTWRDRAAIFLGLDTLNLRTLDASTLASVERNPDLRARRFLVFAILLAQLAHVASINTTIAAVGIAITVCAFFIKTAPRSFWWRMVLLILTFAAGVLIVLSYGKLIGRDAGIALLFLFGPLKLIEARSSRDYMWVWGLGLILYVASFFENLGLGGAVTLPFVIVIYIAALRLFDAPAAEKKAPTLAAHVKQAAAHTLMGIPLAAILFVLFPRATAPLWGMRDQSVAQTGLSEEMQPGEIANLIRSRETAFRVVFENGKRPPNNALYWRGPVLRMFDGVRWSTGDAALRGEFESFTAEELQRDAITYTVTVERLSTRWLPVLEVPAAFPTGPAVEQIAFLSDAQQIGLRRTPNGATAYRVQSLVRPNYQGVGNASLFLELRTGPASINPRARAFANQLKNEFADPKERIRALLTYFNREQFFYTLNPPQYSAGGNGPTSIDRFLFDGKRGFCEHYAGATVFLLRASGIPARVVTGYQGGEWHPSGYMIVRQSDAHAWAEALVDGRWIRIDPTAAVAPNRVELGLSDALPEAERLLVNTRRWFESAQFVALWEQANFTYTKWVIGFDRDRQRELMRDLGLGDMNPLSAIGWMLIAVSASGGLIALAWWLSKRRSEKRLDRSVQLWHALRKRLVKAGMPIATHETVAEALARARERWPAYTATFERFASIYNRSRFAANASSASIAANERELEAILRALPFATKLKRTAAHAASVAGAIA
jgi:protein-glutamine gamma-glutamyltransferase